MAKGKRKTTQRKRKKLKLPSSVTLGAHVIPIKMQHDLMVEAEAFGMFDPNKLEILIDDKVNDNLILETILHELIEAISFLTESEIEHRTIQVMGLMLHQGLESMFKLSEVCRE